LGEDTRGTHSYPHREHLSVGSWLISLHRFLQPLIPIKDFNAKPYVSWFGNRPFIYAYPWVFWEYTVVFRNNFVLFDIPDPTFYKAISPS
jgi:hypothetical protein